MAVMTAPALVPGARPGATLAASSLLNSSRQIGASLGLAALGTAAHERTGAALTPGPSPTGTRSA